MFFISRCKYVWYTITQHKQLFFIGLCIKLLLGALFAGDYLVHLFAPFLKYTTTVSFTTAYNYFTTDGKGNEFPYPYIMQCILSLPRFLLSFILVNDAIINFIDVWSIRIALLISDMAILFVLLQWLRKHSKQVLWLYWLSPILMYINYVHGQLDVVPIALLLISLYYLFKNKVFASSLFLVLSVGCKTSILLAVPFILITTYKMKSIPKKNFWMSCVLLLIGMLFIIMPVLFSKGYALMVFNNAEQFKLFSTYLIISGSSLFLIVPALYFILVIRFATYWQVSRDLVLMYLGFAFGIITIFVAANQGWYYWCLPFFIYFVIKENRFAKLPFVLFTILYFLHFAVSANSDYYRVWQLINNTVASKNNIYTTLVHSGANAPLYSNIISTLLQTTLLVFCYGIYRFGITQIKQYKMLHQPYLIGISGDSASGKTTLSRLLQQLFTTHNATIINGDDMHKWERGNEQYNTTTHLNPLANHLHTNLLHFLQLAKGNHIQRRSYNHHSGFFDAPKKVNAAKVLLFEGLHTYYLQHQATLFDLCIFTKPNEALRTQWKIKRDVDERGHAFEKVLEAMEYRKLDAATYIMQQEKNADVVISILPGSNDTIEFQFNNNLYVDKLVARLLSEGLTIRHTYTNEIQIVNINGDISQAAIDKVGEEYAATLAELGFGEVKWSGNIDGLIQLFLLHIIFYKLELNALMCSDVL